MDVEQMQLIEHKCERVILQCARHTDLEEYEEAAALFAPDVAFIGAVSPVGREANIESMKARGTRFNSWRRRVVTNMIVQVHDADHATVTAYWMIYSLDKSDFAAGKVSSVAPTHFNETVDELVRLNEGWRIAQRELIRVIGDEQFGKPAQS
jgi:hypothetical protein